MHGLEVDEIILLATRGVLIKVLWSIVIVIVVEPVTQSAVRV